MFRRESQGISHGGKSRATGQPVSAHPRADAFELTPSSQERPAGFRGLGKPLPGRRVGYGVLRRVGRAPGFGVVAILLLVVAYATLLQGPGFNQNSHYALTRALAVGTPSIDQTRYQTGPFWVTGDISAYHGHTYSNKAPGFAFATLPAYLALKAVGGAQPARDVSGQLWLLGLWSVVLPALLLLLLVRKLANELEPGFGAAAAAACSSSPRDAHAAVRHPLFLTSSPRCSASALLRPLARTARAAQTLLPRRRGRPRGLRDHDRVPERDHRGNSRRRGAHTPSSLPACAPPRGGGALVGLAPLLAYDQWAFGSPFHLSYRYTVGFGSTSSLFLATPSFRRLIEVLFAPAGSFRTTPVIALAGVGCVLLFRRGYRFEACVSAAVALSFLLFEASYLTPFGGASPGPRQLIPMLPFVALLLATALRRMPLTTLALAAVSAVEMVAATITHPLYYSEQSANWFHRLGVGNFSGTVTDLPLQTVIPRLARASLDSGLVSPASLLRSGAARDCLHRRRTAAVLDTPPGRVPRGDLPARLGRARA